MNLYQRELEWVSFLEGDTNLDREEVEEEDFDITAEPEFLDVTAKPEVLAFKVQQHSKLPKLKLRKIIQDHFIMYCNKYPDFSKILGILFQSLQS